MSFMKSGRSHLSQGKKSARPKRSAAKKEWVSTVNDLSVHRSTPAELTHRHEIHKSHNTAVAQWELKEKTLRGRLKQPGSPATMDPASLSIIREVFSDQLLLQDVLARSDRAMAVVKDLFGDAPRRHTGHPSVTLAPDCDSDSQLPVVQRADPPTQLALLSHSTMNQQALNELETSDEDHSEEETQPAAVAGARPGPRADLHKMKTRTAGGHRPQQLRARPSPRHRVLGHSGPRTPCGQGPAPDPAALNATLAVQRVSSRTRHPEEGQGAEPEVQDSQVFNSSGLPTAAPCRQRKTHRPHHPHQTSGRLDGSAVLSLSQNQSNLDLLQAMLGQVEADLDSLGPQGPEREAQLPPRTQGLTGFSVALVSTLGRVVDLLRQKEEEAQKEACERSRLQEEVLDQRGLIDALTSESLTLREESAALQQRTSQMDQLLETVVLALGGLGGLGLRDDPNTQPDLTHSPLTDYSTEWLSTEFDSRLAQAPVSTAILLSAPQQRDLLPHGPACPPGTYLRPRHGDTALTHDPPSLSSSTPLVTPDPERRPPLSEEALVAEITRLSQQNALIKAQLTQTRALGSALNTTSSSARSGDSVSSGSVPGVRRASAGREKGTQQVLLTEEARLQSPEAAGSGASSGGSVEQRLLELNRQSRAARGRLLELIEQQRQSASPVSTSPIPPSAFSPHPAGGRTPESSVSLPDQEGSRGSGGKRLPAANASVPVQGPESHDTPTLPTGPRGVRGQGGDQGWFALSSHVRAEGRRCDVIQGHS